MIHVEHDIYPTLVGDRVTVGHSVTLHGCVVEDDCLIGIGAIVLNGAKIGKGSVVAAGAVVPERMQVPPFSMVMGVPAKVKREVTDSEERARFARTRSTTFSTNRNLPERAILIRAVKGRATSCRRSAVWNHVESVARRGLPQPTTTTRSARRSSKRRRCSPAASAKKPTSSAKRCTPSRTATARSLTLRPENTASVIRAYIEHRLDQQPGLQEALLHRARCSAASVRRRDATGSSFRSARRRSARNRRPLTPKSSRW